MVRHTYRNFRAYVLQITSGTRRDTCAVTHTQSLYTAERIIERRRAVIQIARLRHSVAPMDATGRVFQNELLAMVGRTALYIEHPTPLSRASLQFIQPDSSSIMVVGVNNIRPIIDV